MKKYLLVIGLLCIIIGYTAIQIAIETLTEIDIYYQDMMAGNLAEDDVLIEEQELMALFGRYEATAMVSRAIIVFGVIVTIYSMKNELIGLKNKIFN